MKKELPLAQLEPIKRHIRSKLLPKLGCNPDDFELVALDSGRRGPIILCKGNDNSFVFKMYRSPNRFLNAKKAHEYFAQQELPSPHILHSQLCIDVRAGFSRFLLVQEEVTGPGIHEIEDRDNAICETGKSLARMHSHKREIPGRFHVTPYRRIRKKFKQKRSKFLGGRFNFAMSRLEQLEEGKAFTEAEGKNVARSLENARSQIRDRNTHDLIHGDFGASQVIMHNGKPTFIDLDTACFDNFGYELFSAKNSLCRTDSERELLLNSYFAIAGVEALNWYNTAERFFELAYHIGRAKRYFKRSKGESEESGLSQFQQRYRFHKDQLMARSPRKLHSF